MARTTTSSLPYHFRVIRCHQPVLSGMRQMSLMHGKSNDGTDLGDRQPDAVARSVSGSLACRGSSANSGASTARFRTELTMPRRAAGNTPRTTRTPTYTTIRRPIPSLPATKSRMSPPRLVRSLSGSGQAARASRTSSTRQRFRLPPAAIRPHFAPAQLVRFVHSVLSRPCRIRSHRNLHRRTPRPRTSRQGLPRATRSTRTRCLRRIITSRTRFAPLSVDAHGLSLAQAGRRCRQRRGWRARSGRRRRKRPECLACAYERRRRHQAPAQLLAGASPVNMMGMEVDGTA